MDTRIPITTNDLAKGIDTLEGLADGEYSPGTTLSTILRDEDRDLGFKRIGRLMAVWPKSAFAETSDYDPTLSANWARATRCWEIHSRPTEQSLERNWAQAELLIHFAREWDRPIEVLFEFNIFLSLCKGLRPVVCGQSKVFANADKVAKELEKHGHTVSLLTTNQVLGAAAVGAANYFIQTLPWLTAQHMPVVTGCAVLAICFGQRKLCQALQKFIESDDPSKDRFSGVAFPRCSSTATNDRTPCKNRVRREGERCWIHLRRAPAA